MLMPFWFHTDRGLGFGGTAESRQAAEKLLRDYRYLGGNLHIVGVTENIRFEDLDQNHVVPNAGPMVVRGIWYPRHNI